MVKVNVSDNNTSCTPNISNVEAKNIHLPGLNDALHLQYEKTGSRNYNIHSTMNGEYLGSVKADVIPVGNALKLIEHHDTSEDNYELEHHIFHGCNNDQLYLDLVNPKTMVSSRHLLTQPLFDTSCNIYNGSCQYMYWKTDSWYLSMDSTKNSTIDHLIII